MPLVFLSYRKCDQPWVAYLLDHVLSSRLGADEVFLDSRKIALGENYAPRLLAEVRASVVQLAIIGANWFASGPTGRLIDDPEDWVRREISEALAADVRVIPVMVGDIAVLVAEDLPSDIRLLAEVQYVRLREREAYRDIVRVVDDIVAIEPRLSRPRKSVTRKDLDRLVREVLPQSAHKLGNHNALVDAAWRLLLADERLRYVAPCQFSSRVAGSAVLLATERRICVADLYRDKGQVLSFPLIDISGTEVHRRRRVGLVPTADLVFHTRDGNRIQVRGLLRAHAEKVVELVA